jgi:hypothetical protein
VCVLLQELHARLEPLLIFTIDGASFIDAEDPKWEVVAAVMQHNGRPYLVRGSVLLSQPGCQLQDALHGPFACFGAHSCSCCACSQPLLRCLRTQAGWCTLYNFYAWPLSHRPRLAQVGGCAQSCMRPGRLHSAGTLVYSPA